MHWIGATAVVASDGEETASCVCWMWPLNETIRSSIEPMQGQRRHPQWEHNERMLLAHHNSPLLLSRRPHDEVDNTSDQSTSSRYILIYCILMVAHSNWIMTPLGIVNSLSSFLFFIVIIIAIIIMWFVCFLYYSWTFQVTISFLSLVFNII